MATGIVLTLAACGGGGNSPGARAASPSAGVPLQKQIVDVVGSVDPRVVQIETSRGLGSGVVFDGKGDIVTNAHVVGSSTSFRITSADGKRFAGTLVGVYRPDDLAVVRAQGSDLKPATFGKSSALKVGDLVLAIGNPLGLRSSVTNGIVSALGRTVSEPNGSVLPNVIQTSAAINPGNSGGALVDLQGEVVGIPTLAATDPELGGSAAPGIGFAIPSDVVRDIAGQIVKHGRVVNSHRAFLGVSLGGSAQVRGAVVAAVQGGGPAAKAGIRPGDLIVAVAGHPVGSPNDVASILSTLRPGQTIGVKVARPGGATKTVQVTLGQFPAGH
ncbi:MAG TPA: trypsin-like peptidase domain-containing protein [Thermoleophilaceae bacterium]|nr:trypsin-like peptidase domain-containing protein [Thermoleophilaceae bacterium]